MRDSFRLIDVPKEFDLRKYDVCQKWEPVQWYTALSWRKYIGYERLIDSKDLTKDFDALLDCDIDHTDKIISDPTASPLELSSIPSAVKDQSVFEFFLGYLYIYCNLGPDGKIFNESGLKSYFDRGLEIASEFENFIESMGINQPDPDIKINRLLSWIQDKPEFNSPAFVLHKDALITPYKDIIGDRYFLSIDAQSNDRTLIRDFKSWLKELRRKTKKRIPPGTVTIDTLKRWHTLKYLPYLDLHCWARARKGRIPAKAMLAPLNLGNPDRPKGAEETIRRDYRPKAPGILTDEKMAALKNLIADSMPHNQDEE